MKRLVATAPLAARRPVAAGDLKSAVVTVAACIAIAVTGVAGGGYIAVEREIDGRVAPLLVELDGMAKKCAANPLGAALCGVMAKAIVTGPVLHTAAADCRKTTTSLLNDGLYSSRFFQALAALPAVAQPYAVGYVCDRGAARGKAEVLARFGG